MAGDPFTEFTLWFEGVIESDFDQPNAFVLATSNEAGQPSARAVLMKGFSESGLVFYTNMTSRKSIDLTGNPRAAAAFVWTPLHRQVRFEGTVETVSDAEADAYFATRPKGAQIAAHASDQSSVVESRAALDAVFASLDAEFEVGQIPRPGHWGGWRLIPETVEFWQGRPDRFHDRVRYRRAGGIWEKERLAP